MSEDTAELAAWLQDKQMRERLEAERLKDQPPPIPNDGRPIWDLVIEDMIQRNITGIERYGTPLQAHNGRDPLVDAYQEALDLVVYLRQAIEERAHPVVELNDEAHEEIKRHMQQTPDNGQCYNLKHIISMLSQHGYRVVRR